MIPSLHAQYLRERTNREILEVEEGFATYEYLPDGIVYIVDIYVVPDKRKTKIASMIADKICEIAARDGMKILQGSVDIRAKGATASLKVLEAYGMKVFKVEDNMIYYSKPIQDILKNDVEVV